MYIFHVFCTSICSCLYFVHLREHVLVHFHVYLDDFLGGGGVLKNKVLIVGF
jgi:hypothetical protein